MANKATFCDKLIPYLVTRKQFLSILHPNTIICYLYSVGLLLGSSYILGNLWRDLS